MKKILLVDDDPELTSELVDIIQGEGFHVDIAASGPEGERLLNSVRYDAAVIDFKMPGFDGIELLKKINGAMLPSKIIVMSGSLDIQKMIDEKLMKSLVVHAMQKPFAVEDLIENLKQMGG